VVKVVGQLYLFFTLVPRPTGYDLGLSHGSVCIYATHTE
jgi:hypothetical protein